MKPRLQCKMLFMSILRHGNACAIFIYLSHHDVIRWKHFSRYWPFVRGIHRSPVNSPLKGQLRGALMFSLICVWIDGLSKQEGDDLRRCRSHYDVTVMLGRLFTSKKLDWISFALLQVICCSCRPYLTACKCVTHFKNYQRTWNKCQIEKFLH